MCVYLLSKGPGGAGMSGALPTLVVADDFVVPSTVEQCTQLTVDAGILRTLGRTSGNARVPSRVLVYLWDDRAFFVNQTWDQTAAPLYSWSFATPAEPETWTSAAYGYTIDTLALYQHVESLRFNLTELALEGGRTYWIGLALALDRAFNTSDFSQNQPRWMVTTNTALRNAQQQLGGAATQAYRVIDAASPAGAAMFRAAPALGNWTGADAAEPTVLPFLTSNQPQHSTTRQLAIGVFASACTVFALPPTATALPDGVPTRIVDAAAQLRWQVKAAPSPPLAVVVAPSPLVQVTFVPPPPPVVVVEPPPPSPWIVAAVPSSENASLAATPAHATAPDSFLAGLNMWLLAAACGVVLLALGIGTLWMVTKRCSQKYQSIEELSATSALRDGDGVSDDDDDDEDDNLMVPLDASPPSSTAVRPSDAAIQATYAAHVLPADSDELHDTVPVDLNTTRRKNE